MTELKREKKLSHLETLKSKHLKLDRRIQVCYDERVDDTHLHKMKQEKLRLKDEIAKLEEELEL